MKKKEITVLCIDDDEQIRYALEQLCLSQKWKCFSAGDVPSGLRIFTENEIDIVLIDYHLPAVNGVDGVKLLRRQSAKTPIIVFTIEDDQAVADEFLKAGANDFALKPIRVPDLLSRIRLHIRLMESERQNLYGESWRKGISSSTAELILQCLQEAAVPLTTEQIAERTGIANQTAYRYLQYLAGDGLIEKERSYGKVGRPLQTFRAVRK